MPTIRIILLLSLVFVHSSGVSADPDDVYHHMVKQALIAAHGILDDDLRDTSLAVIAKGQTETGRPAEAARTAHQIESAAVRGRVLGIIAEMYLENDDVTSALATANSIADPTSRDQALRDLSEWRAREGAWEDAHAMMELIGNSADRAIALSDIAEIRARRGSEVQAAALMEDALALTSAISTPALRATALAELAQAQAGIAGSDAAARLFELAMEAARQIDNEGERDRVVYMTAKTRSLVDIDRTSETLENLVDPLWRAMVYREMGKEYGLAERQEDSRKALEAGVNNAVKIPDDPARARALGKLAEFFVEQHDDINRAVEIVRLAATADSRDIILVKIVGALSESENLEAAETLTDLMQATSVKVLSLLDIAKSHTDRGDIASAERLVIKAVEMEKANPVRGSWPEIQRSLAETYAKQGKIDKAVATAASIDSLHYRATAFSGIAEVLGNTGRRGPPHKR